MRKLLSLLIVTSVLGIVACAAPDDADYETLREKCKNNPSLPECQEEDNWGGSDDGSSSGDDF